MVKRGSTNRLVKHTFCFLFSLLTPVTLTNHLLSLCLCPFWKICMRRDPPKMQLSSVGWVPYSYRLPVLGECSWNSPVSVYQLALLWESAFGFSEFVWKILSMCLRISQWFIYECTCPHSTEHPVVFYHIGITPMPYPPYLSNLTQSNFLLFPWMKKALKGKHFADVEEVKQKTVEALKGIKINKFKICFEQWEKTSK